MLMKVTAGIVRVSMAFSEALAIKFTIQSFVADLILEAVCLFVAIYFEILTT